MDVPEKRQGLNSQGSLVLNLPVSDKKGQASSSTLNWGSLRCQCYLKNHFMSLSGKG